MEKSDPKLADGKGKEEGRKWDGKMTQIAEGRKRWRQQGEIYIQIFLGIESGLEENISNTKWNSYLWLKKYNIQKKIFKK